jgi:hypothetical protein
MNWSALHGAAQEGKIFHNGRDTAVARLSTMDWWRSKATTAHQDRSSVVSLMQRMVSDRTEFLEKYLKNQEKQAWLVWRSPNKSCHKWCPWWAIFQCHSQPANTKPKSPLQRNTPKRDYSKKFPIVILSDHQDVNGLHQTKKLSMEGCSFNDRLAEKVATAIKYNRNNQLIVYQCLWSILHR